MPLRAWVTNSDIRDPSIPNLFFRTSACPFHFVSFYHLWTRWPLLGNQTMSTTLDSINQSSMGWRRNP